MPVVCIVCRFYCLLFVLSVVCIVCCLYCLLFVLSVVCIVCRLYCLSFVMPVVCTVCRLYCVLFVLCVVCIVCCLYCLLFVITDNTNNRQYKRQTIQTIDNINDRQYKQQTVQTTDNKLEIWWSQIEFTLHYNAILNIKMYSCISLGLKITKIKIPGNIVERLWHIEQRTFQIPSAKK
jgi:hypothetical protein